MAWPSERHHVPIQGEPPSGHKELFLATKQGNMALIGPNAADARCREARPYGSTVYSGTRIPKDWWLGSLQKIRPWQYGEIRYLRSYLEYCWGYRHVLVHRITWFVLRSAARGLCPHQVKNPANGRRRPNPAIRG